MLIEKFMVLIISTITIARHKGVGRSEKGNQSCRQRLYSTQR
jgi:hypothetical protein